MQRAVAPVHLAHEAVAPALGPWLAAQRVAEADRWAWRTAK